MQHNIDLGPGILVGKLKSEHSVTADHSLEMCLLTPIAG